MPGCVFGVPPVPVVMAAYCSRGLRQNKKKMKREERTSIVGEEGGETPVSLLNTSRYCNVQIVSLRATGLTLVCVLLAVSYKHVGTMLY